jgi:glycosyltransferase involved in cell wall biosynthesis
MTILWHRLRAPLPIEALAGRADVLHAPDFSLPPTLGARTVVTIHDLAFMTHPECAVPSLRAYLNRVVPRAVKRADHIIAVSQRTADDLVELLGVAPKKITVIHLGIDPSMRRITDAAALADAQERYGLRLPFALAVGTIEPRKNFARLIEAFDLARRQAGGPAQLVIAGRKGWLYDDVFETVERLGLGDAVRFLDYVPDADLATLYSLAAVVTMPSLYEGFGIPVVEAMACGVPVVASTGGSLPEIVGDAGLLAASDDVSALANALARAVGDAALRERLITAGYARARTFDWDAAARQHIAVYHAVAVRV